MLFLCAFALLPLAAVCEGARGPERFCGEWTGDSVSVFIAMEDEEIFCLAIVRRGDDAREAWEYGACWYDEEQDAVLCGCVTKTQQYYSELFDEWMESDWSMNDLYYARFAWSEDGEGLVWTDDGLEEPLTLTRAEQADDSQERGEMVCS